MISKTFLKGHPKAGHPTEFREKIEDALLGKEDGKKHTIRASNRFKIGDRVSLRQWSDKPYRSKQIEISEVTIKKVYPIHFDKKIINGKKVLHFTIFDEFGEIIFYQRAIEIDSPFYELQSGIRKLANNDGLHGRDFVNWFESYDDFIGQIICWVDPKY